MLERFPQHFPHGFAFLNKSLCRIEQVVDKVREYVLERFAFGQLRGHAFLCNLGQLPARHFHFPPGIALTPEPWCGGESHHRTS